MTAPHWGGGMAFGEGGVTCSTSYTQISLESKDAYKVKMQKNRNEMNGYRLNTSLAVKKVEYHQNALIKSSDLTLSTIDCNMGPSAPVKLTLAYFENIQCKVLICHFFL